MGSKKKPRGLELAQSLCENMSKNAEKPCGTFENAWLYTYMTTVLKNAPLANASLGRNPR